MDRLNLDRFKILAAAATLAMFAGTACAETELYGWVNRSIAHTDDGYQQNTLFYDNAFNNSTLGAKGMGHLNKCVMFGGVLEAQMQPNNSREISQLDNTDLSTNLMRVRRADTWVDGGVWGKLSLGYGDAVSYGIMRMSYSRSGDTVSSALVQSLAGGLLFHNSASAVGVVALGAGATPSVNMVFNAPDGVGSIDSLTGVYAQKNRVRWDSDKWMGLSLGVSFGNVQERDGLLTTVYDYTATSQQFTDVALRYEGNFGGFMLSGGVAWAQYTRSGANVGEYTVSVLGATRNTRIWAGSVAALHKCTGINVAVAYGNERKIFASQDNKQVWFFQVGDSFDFSHYGKTNVVLDYYYGKHNLINNDKAKSYAIGVTQEFCKVNTSFYATVRGYQYEDGVNLALVRTNYDKIWVASAGFLFKFGAML